jgi:hypothetical protein
VHATRTRSTKRSLDKCGRLFAMCRQILFAVLLATCGGSTSPEWAGKWIQQNANPPGTFVEMNLLGSGMSVSGNGVQHRQGGVDLTFTVDGSIGTPGSHVVFHYADGSTELFNYSQPDSMHLVLVGHQRTLDLIRP